MAPSFSLRVFGPPDLFDPESRPVRFRTRKQLALLVYLTLQARQRPVERDEVVDLLWGDVSQARGRHSLSQGLTVIRDRLGAKVIVRRERGIQFCGDIVTELEMIASGSVIPDVLHPLQDLDRWGGADFAHWVDGQRVSLIEAAREALRKALRAARERGDLQAVHRAAGALHRVDPLCADAVQALAERALLDGDAITAIRVLRGYVERVVTDLGATPPADVTRLLRRLERGDIPLPPVPVMTARGPRPRREVFVGREAELARLEARWQRVRESSPQACLITGVAGIGKSSLVRRFATSVAARAAPVFVTNCQEIGANIPFAAVSDLLEGLARDANAGATDPHWLAEASRVSPGLRSIYPGMPEPAPAPAESVRLRVAEALLHVTRAVADDRPILLVLDDIQNMDPASRDVLFLLSRRLERTPAMVLGTIRSALGGFVRGGGTRPFSWVEITQLAPLDAKLISHLVDGLLAAPEPVEDPVKSTIVRLAQGNPYHAEMLLADWRRNGASSLASSASTMSGTALAWQQTDTLRLAFARDYDGLSVDAQHLLQLLSVARRAMTTAELSAVLGGSSEPMERSIVDLIDRGLMRFEAGRLGFKNELHRAFVYGMLDDTRRGFFHSALADLLASDTSDFQRTLEASHHYVNAGMPEQAIHTVIEGAETAIKRSASREAERALRTVLDKFETRCPLRIHLLLAEACLSTGQSEEALSAVMRCAFNDTEVIELARAAQVRAEALHRGRLADESAISDAAAEASSLTEASGCPALYLKALQVKAEVAADGGRLGTVRRVARAANCAEVKSQDAEVKALSAMTQGYCYLALRDWRKARTALHRALPVLSGLLHVERRRALNGLGICLTALGEPVEASRFFNDAIRAGERLGDPTTLSNAWANLGVVHQDAARYAEAAHCYRQALTNHGLRVGHRTTGDVFLNPAQLAIELGSTSEAEWLIDRAQDFAARLRFWRQSVAALLMRADLLLSKGQPECTWSLVEEAVWLGQERFLTLADPVQFARLHAHHVLATRGYGHFLSHIQRAHPKPWGRPAQQLELEGFYEWVRRKEGDDRPAVGAPVLARAQETGLLGALSRLASLHIYPDGVADRRDGQTSAQLIAELFPDSARAVLPRRVWAVTTGDGPPHFA